MALHRVTKLLHPLQSFRRKRMPRAASEQLVALLLVVFRFIGDGVELGDMGRDGSTVAVESDDGRREPQAETFDLPRTTSHFAAHLKPSALSGSTTDWNPKRGHHVRQLKTVNVEAVLEKFLAYLISCVLCVEHDVALTNVQREARHRPEVLDVSNYFRKDFE
eukprot:9483638-Pyramimonas_sp.AAC.1